MDASASLEGGELWVFLFCFVWDDNPNIQNH